MISGLRLEILLSNGQPITIEPHRKLLQQAIEREFGGYVGWDKDILQVEIPDGMALAGILSRVRSILKTAGYHDALVTEAK